MSAFQAVAVTRLYRIIADQIAGRIRAGDFLPGARIPAERELAEQLQVSRASIREALIALEIEGYVEVRVGTGVFVAQPKDQDFLPATRHKPPTTQRDMEVTHDIGPFDLLAARLLIEPECAALTAQQGTALQLDQIKAAFQAMSFTDSPSMHDRNFHSAIAAACGNAALAASVAHLWNMSEASSLFSRLEDYFVTAKVWETAHAEHSRILEAILDRDPIRARHAMHAHIVGILARLREDFGRDDSVLTDLGVGTLTDRLLHGSRP